MVYFCFSYYYHLILVGMAISDVQLITVRLQTCMKIEICIETIVISIHVLVLK